jgi:hypothetical protein
MGTVAPPTTTGTTTGENKADAPGMTVLPSDSQTLDEVRSEDVGFEDFTAP